MRVFKTYFASVIFVLAGSHAVVRWRFVAYCSQPWVRSCHGHGARKCQCRTLWCLHAAKDCHHSQVAHVGVSLGTWVAPSVVGGAGAAAWQRCHSCDWDGTFDSQPGGPAAALGRAGVSIVYLTSFAGRRSVVGWRPQHAKRWRSHHYRRVLDMERCMALRRPGSVQCRYILSWAARFPDGFSGWAVALR